MTPIPARIEVTLYQHDKTAGAIWLSPDGSYTRAKWIPLMFVTCPPTLELMNVKGLPLQRGVFCVEQWKLIELGWLQQGEDERQGELL